MHCKGLWRLNPLVNIRELNDGIATFNTFSGDTQFVEQPFDVIVKLLQSSALSTEKIIALAIAHWPDQQPLLIADNIKQFLTQAADSAIIMTS